MRQLSLVLFASVTLVMTGCATVKTVPVPATLKPSLQNQALSLNASPKPAFPATTALNAQFALVGALVAVENGNKLIQENGVEDPAVQIAKNLAQELATRYQVTVPSDVVIASESDAKRAAAQANAKYLLSVSTVHWGSVYFPTNWTNYRVVYNVRARLIDTSTQKVVAQASCNPTPKNDDNAPSWEQMTANKAAIMKGILADYTVRCSQEMIAAMFSQ